MAEESEKRPFAKKVQKKVPKKITPAYLHNYALFYLERFSSSSANVRRILLNRARKSVAHHKEPAMEDIRRWIDEEIQKLIRTQILDDAAYARATVLSMQRKGMSKRSIEAKAAQKGIAGPLLKTVMAENRDENAEMEAALTHKRRKKLGINPENRKKDLASLARAGFSYDIACRALSEKE